MAAMLSTVARLYEDMRIETVCSTAKLVRGQRPPRPFFLFMFI
jgi:hypothetical protein